MVQIEEVPIEITIPDNGVGMVIMQPFVELCSHEPYRWQNDKKDKQIERIIRTLEIAKQADHGCGKTHYTILPEYAIPGLEGIRRIQEILESSSWGNGTVFIGGVDGLTKSEYSTLCSEDNTEVHRDNRPACVRNDQWVNCCIVWAKEENGNVKRWIQPKLCPSWPEEDVPVSDMFEGKSVYIFEGRFTDGRAFRFMSLLCRDWIGSSGSRGGIYRILEDLNQLPGAEPYGKPLHLCFVLQCNEKPNHPSFLNNAYEFFHERRYQFVDRNNAAVAMVNTAGDSKPGMADAYGYSCFVFSPNSGYTSEGCPPTYALATETIRGNTILRTCKEALFRENGACIHSFRFFHPLFISVAPENRRRPLSSAFVHAWEDLAPSDPRTPGAPVPAIIKWTNDRIDVLGMLNAHAGIKIRIERAQNEVSNELRQCESNFLYKSLKLSTVKMIDEENVDIWSETERRSLETLVYALGIIDSTKQILIRGSLAHATFTQNHNVVDIIVVSGKTHEENLKHVGNKYPGRKERTTIIISRDQRDGPLFPDRDKAIYDIGSEVKRVGYHALIGCLASTNETELNNRVTEIIGV